jgi:hypothetical protein
MKIEAVRCLDRSGIYSHRLGMKINVDNKNPFRRTPVVCYRRGLRDLGGTSGGHMFNFTMFLLPDTARTRRNR